VLPRGRACEASAEKQLSYLPHSSSLFSDGEIIYTFDNRYIMGRVYLTQEDIANGLGCSLLELTHFWPYIEQVDRYFLQIVTTVG